MRLRNVKNASSIIVEGKYFINNPNEFRGKFSSLFGNNNPIYIEIGMGKGDFIINNALENADINYIGIEKYDSVLVRAIQKSDNLEINNLRFIRMDAKDIESVFDHEVDLIYLNFSDPWPKERHAKRRLTSNTFLNRYNNIFKGDAHIIQKTDNIDLFNYSLNSLEEYGYDIINMSNDLHNTDISNINTEYEDKFVKLGIKINYLEVKKRS